MMSSGTRGRARRAALRRIAAVALTVAGAGCHGVVAPVTGASLFDEVWGAFDRSYAFFDYGQIDWDALGARYRDSVAAAPSDAERARLLGAMVGTLRDYHAGLTTPFGTFGPPPIPYEHHFDPALVRAAYVADAIRPTATGAIYYARLRAGPGYLYVGSFQSASGRRWDDEIESALAALGDVPGLVIDVRDNGGGDELNAQALAARLYDRQRPYRVSRFRNGARHDAFASPTTTSLSPAGTHRYRGPVALVTNRFDGSAAEDFVLMLRALPQVVTVGDTTLGLGSNPLSVTLRNGWTLRVPRSMQSTPDGFVYQWRGLPPAVPVAWDTAAVAAGRDPYLDAAIASLAARR